MTVQELFSVLPREELAKAIVAKFARLGVGDRSGGVANIRRVLDWMLGLPAKGSACRVCLNDVGVAGPDGLDVVVYEPDDPEAYSFIMQKCETVLGHQVDEGSLSSRGPLRCAVDIFWEMTFFGERQKDDMLSAED